MAVTLHDVARQAGVSIKTVSNVVNNSPNVKASTRERVLEAIKNLDYRPNLSARSLRSGHSNMIGLALPELSLSYFAELADKVIRAAERHGLVVLIEQTGRSREREIEVLTGTRPRMIDGLLYSPLELGQDDASLIDIGLPLVLLGERIFNTNTDHVTMQNVQAARAATEHLLATGRKRVAVIGAHPGEVIGSAGLRLRGYREALAAAGIPYDASLVGEAVEWYRKQGAEAMTALLDSGVRFDSVFAFNDTLALGAIHILRERGIRVPEDVAIIGWDNIEEGAFSTPTLTSVDPGRNEIAETAVNLLVERIATKDLNRQPREIEVDFTIVRREST
jgi:DNA-binding LacI/PurR family transcriptional regulator